MEKNQLQQRVIRRLTELDIGPVEAAERVPGLERNYIRDLVNDKKQSFSQSKLPLVAQALEWSVPDVLGSPQHSNGTVNQPTKQSQRTIEKISPQGGALQHNARMGEPIEGFTRVPLRGRGMGGKDGVLIFETGEPPEYVEAPAKLHGVPGAYAVYVVGNSMLERYANGEIVFVHPRLPLSKGDYCVIQISTDEEATVSAWVKRFVSFDDKTLKVEQLNPKKVLTFPAKTVRAVHKIIMGGSV
jgi:phage repressor protein C with HTH and peptisase S24 domain